MKWIKCFISSSQCWVVGPCYANLCCIQRSTVCVQNRPPFVAQIQEFPSQILGAILWTVLLSCNSCILYIDIYMLSSGSCQVPLEQISPRMKDTTSAKKHPEKNPLPGEKPGNRFQARLEAASLATGELIGEWQWMPGSRFHRQKERSAEKWEKESWGRMKHRWILRLQTENNWQSRGLTMTYNKPTWRKSQGKHTKFVSIQN